jgi:hypothetical protein
MILSAFHTAISREVNKKTRFDDLIPDYVRRAARFIERQHSLKYMERFVTFTVDAAATEPRAVAFPNSRVKAINFLRYADSDSKYYYVGQVDPTTVAAAESGNPTGYWMDGLDYLWFDNVVKANLAMEFSFIEYTLWPTDTAQEPWLLAHAEDLMIAQTMLMMAPVAREPGWKELYSDMKAEGLQSLFVADEEMKASSRDESMIYE